MGEWYGLPTAHKQTCEAELRRLLAPQGVFNNLSIIWCHLSLLLHIIDLPIINYAFYYNGKKSGTLVCFPFVERA